MKENTVVQFNFRCPKAIVDLIDRDIEETGEFRNRSEWNMAAIRYFIDYRTKIILDRKEALGEGKNETAGFTGQHKMS